MKMKPKGKSVHALGGLANLIKVIISRGHNLGPPSPSSSRGIDWLKDPLLHAIRVWKYCPNVGKGELSHGYVDLTF